MLSANFGKAVWLARVLNVRVALAILAGVVWAAAFPRPGWAGLAWIAPGLMLAAALGGRPSRAFRLGYLSGLAYCLLSLHWLLYNPFPMGALAGWLALSFYLALYPAVWVWFCLRVLPGCPKATQSDADSGTTLCRLGSVVEPIASIAWLDRVLWCIVAAAAWVVLETLRARLFTGFPWNSLGVSQLPLLPLIQLASVTGVYGISFLVVWGSTALLCTGATVMAQIVSPSRPKWAAVSTPAYRGQVEISRPHPFRTSFRLAFFADVGFPLVVVLLLTFAGGARLMRRTPPDREIKVALVQPSIPQRRIFDPQESTNRFETLMSLTRLALAAKPDLVVWPEASLPSFDESHFRILTNAIADHAVWMVFGADDAEPRAGKEEQQKYNYYNSAFLFDPLGRFVATYRKRHLVVFGEYVPLETWFPFMRHLTPIEASITPGTGPVRFEIEDPRAVVSVLICFEDILPHLAREQVDADTDFLLNLTNDAWFGESAAQWQHAANAAFRAVENGLPLVRCTNNGLTCWIDSYGRMRDVGFGAGKDVYASGFRLINAPLLPLGTTRAPTFYRQHGNWFGWCSLVLCLGGAACRRFWL